jgi:hypothetical protein
MLVRVTFRSANDKAHFLFLLPGKIKKIAYLHRHYIMHICYAWYRRISRSLLSVW